ncbi:glycosyltransferase [Robertkochia solimangrovi]|uniref:glycosyltransferase n=1 Tax=Robertkochia solimangrovi TaxID=2213046 RepID=UPI001180E59F|nr:glycosyltransferase [Robertkochia solimangrovi]TRZ43319.1 glycosyltransferase [Robertkochia solimangrovi]
MERKKRILIAPLNWGLGHATRCIPIIRLLLESGFDPVIGSDGDALQLLQNEFEDLEFVELPEYKIQYAEKGRYFKLKMVWDSPKIMKAISKEHKMTKKIVEDRAIDGIISDNRLGVYSKKVPSVFITHQLNVLTGNTTRFSSAIHQKVISKFQECWVPDVAGEPNLSGVLGHPEKPLHNVRYIGPLSRLEKLDLPLKYELMVLLSGPEPQRSMLEQRLLEQVQDFKGNVLFVRGKIEPRQSVVTKGVAKVYNFMTSEQLEVAFAKSRMILCRSGYTTVMDLAKLDKKAFFIPTPGQYEQEYIAERLKKLQLVPSCCQDTFSLDMLSDVENYKGLSKINSDFDLNRLFDLFKCE